MSDRGTVPFFSCGLWGKLSVHEWGVVGLLAVTFVVVGLVNPSFLAAGSLRNVLMNCVPTLIVACGVTFVIVTGEIDISVGSLMGLLAAVMGVLAAASHAAWPVGAVVIATLALGTLIGLFNGVLVTVGRVPSIIVSLGLLVSLRGATELVMGGRWITNLPSGLRWLGTGRVAGIDVGIWIAASVLVAAVVLAHWTPLGRRLYAVGSNTPVAHLTGLSPTRVKIAAFGLTGFLTAVATLVSVPRLPVVESGIGKGFELLVVTCVVVGGTSINGGRGTIFGSALGVLLMTIIGTVLIFLRLGETAVYWEQAIRGGFILGAVLLGHVVSLRGRRGELR